MGFNGAERPGAVYLAAVMAAHSQEGLPACSNYGRDFQDVGDRNILDEVRQKLLRFARAALVWTKANCTEGKDYNDDAHKRTRRQQDEG
ncbi:MAG TPA: hypothetical protein VLE70_17140 [Anaerolineae bacterium]|nr:hypothetical protein [Anaerolineae bacterium]